MLVRRYRWGLSGRGFFVFAVNLAIVFVAFALESYPFLAITSPVPSDTLIVDEWRRMLSKRLLIFRPNLSFDIGAAAKN
jgi:hypothetical protein